MCGIIGYVGKKEAVPVLLNGLFRLEYRGYDSAGLAVLSKNSIHIVKEKGRVQALAKLCENEDVKASTGIAHTRWATHGKPSKLNAHPQLDCHGLFAVVHNGIIENYNELKEFLKNNNYSFSSETDTEVIPNLIHFFFLKTDMRTKEDFLMATRNAIKMLSGSFALEIICSLFDSNMIVIRKDSPLVIGKGENETFVASDIPAILSYTKDFYLLNDFEIAYISQNSVDFYDMNLTKISKETTKINLDASLVQKDGFEDYMLKEIYEQPTSIRETIGTLLDYDTVNFDSLKLSREYLTSLSHVNIVACGTAMHAGLATKKLFEKFLGIPVIVDIASEFRYNNPVISRRSLCIFISQSGETADTIAALRLANSQGATTIVITNVIGSSITREADFTLYTHAGPEIAVASTKAYTSQVALLTLLSLYIAEKVQYDDLTLLNNLKTELNMLPSKIESILKDTDSIKEIAKVIHKEQDVFFLGRGIDYAISLEASLKLKEITYIHSEAYAAGELKHGPIALIDANIPVISILTDETLCAKTLSNIKEVLSRGAKSIIITSLDIRDFKDTDYLIKIPAVSSLLSPILAIIPMQLLAYYVSKFKGIDVDKPRNLAKSVTVE